MILLDTNIFIYLANGIIDTTLLNNKDIMFASITKIEALGFHNITVAESRKLTEIFESSEQCDLNDQIITQAIAIRQSNKIGLGDAIIASTAIENNIELWTANTKDFEHISELKLYNPVKNLQ